MAAATTTIGATGNTPVEKPSKSSRTKEFTVKGTVTGRLVYVPGMVKVTETGITEGVTSSPLTAARGATIATGLLTPVTPTQ